MSEERGFFSAFLPGGGEKKEKGKKKSKDRFIENVNDALKGKDGQKKIEYLIHLIKTEDDGDNLRKLRVLLSNTFGDASETKYHITYDSFSEGLEPVYFWVVDFMSSIGFKIEKTKEDFAASVGSAFYGELGQRATKMQEQAMKMMGSINTVVRSIINLIYDLKEFDIRLKLYDDLQSEKQEEKDASELALKQVWMDQVDIKKGLGSINNMAQQLQFVTLRDAYLMLKSLEEVEKADLNDRVKRILKIKIEEYLKWKEYSEKELRNRYNIEKAYLKSQVASLKLYAAWTKPYLVAAKKLDMKIADMSNVNIVSVFNNMEIELEISGKKEVKVEDLINDKELPEEAKVNDKYYQYITVLLKFRSVPHSVQTPQGYQYRQGGKVDLYFKAYGLSEKEIEELKKSEEDETFRIIDDMVGTSLSAIKEDLDRYSADEKEESKKSKEDVEPGPFTVLYSGFKEVMGPLRHINLKGESYFDGFVKTTARNKTSSSVYTIYDVYKKAHGMMSF